MKIEEHPAFAEKLFPICYALGGAKTPLKVGKIFQMRGYDSDQHFCIQLDGKLYITLCKDGPAHVASDSLCDAINHPEKIIRRPQFSEDEKALMRLLIKNGLSWIGRDHDTESLFAYTKKPTSEDGCFGSNGEEQGIPDCLLRQITFKNSPFDAAAYLESEEGK